MASAEGFLHSPLVVWANNTFKTNILIESITDLADGVFLNEIMTDIDPTYFTLTRIHHNVYGDVNLRMQNLDTLVKHLKLYYQEKLQQLVLLRIPDVVAIARQPESDEAAEELNKILLLMLGCAVQCENKEHFIERITQMDMDVQKSLVEYIQQITDNPDNVIAFRPQELAEYTTDQFLLYAETVFYHMTQLAEDRDNCIGMISHLSCERDDLLHDKENKNLRAFSPPMSPRTSYNTDKFADQANKEKIRLLTEEIEEKNVAITELRDELLASKRTLESLRQENKSLSQDARWVKAYRDEIDSLRAKSDKVDKLEADNYRFKEKLRELDYYKKRSEELKEQNELLYDTKVVLEEQLAGLNTKEERIEILEEENKKLKSHIHHLAEERQFDQLKLKEVMEENAQLIVDKQNSVAEAASLTLEVDALRGKKSPGPSTFASEFSESSSIEVLRMQRENQQLRKTIEELKHSSQRIIELKAENEQLQKAVMDGKTAVYSLTEDVAKLKAKGLQQENDLNKLRAIVKKQHDELRTSVDNVLNLSGELREKGEEIAQIEEQSLLHYQISEEKTKDLGCMAEELKDKEIRIIQLNQEADQKQEKITELSRLAEEREANVMELYQRVKENEQEITNLAKQSESKEEKIAELTKAVQSKEEKLADLNLELRERKREISDLQELLKDSEEAVAKINHKVKDREETIAELKEATEAKDRRMQSLEKRLAEAAEEQSQTEEVLRKQRKATAELENRIEDFLSQNKKSEEHLRRKEDEINELEIRVEETVNHKNKTDENLRKREKEVHELKNGLEKITDQNERLSEELKFKEQKVHSLQKRVEELMLSLDENSEILNKNLKEKEKENKNLETRIEELTEALDEKEKIRLIVKEREDKIETLNKNIDENDKLLQELESRLEESKGATKKLEHVVKLKDKKIEALENSLAELTTTSTVQKDDRIMEMKRNVEGKDNRIIELENRLDDFTLANSKLQQSVKSKEEKIAELETKVEDIKSLTSEKNRLSQSLDHKTKKALDLETKLEEMSNDNQRLQLSNEQKSGKIRSLENKVLELEESLGSSQLLQQNLKLKDDKVSSLNQIIHEREEQVDDLENRLKDAQVRNNKLMHTLKLKEEKITSLEESVESLDELLSETKKLNQTVQLKEEKIKTLENKLAEFEELSSRSTELSECIKQKDDKISRLQERLDEVEGAADVNAKLSKTLKNREEKIESLKGKVSDLQEQLDVREQHHKEGKRKAEERIKALEKKLEEYMEEREVQIHDLQSQLEGTLNRYRRLDMTVGEKEMAIAELQAKLIEAQDDTREIKKLNHIMKTKDARIENLESKLENMKSHVASQQSNVNAKDDKIDNLQKRLDETLKLNNKLDQSVRKKEESIRTLEKTLQANENREEELQKSLETKTERLSEYKSRVKELEANLENKEDKLTEIQKRLDNLKNAASVDAKLSGVLEEKDLKIAEMEQRVKNLSSSFGQVDKLEKAKKEMEQSVLSLETKLEESESQNRRLNHSLKQKEAKIESLETRVAEMEAIRDVNSQSLSTALKQKDSKIAVLNQNLQQQENENMAVEAKLEEVTAQANELSRSLEHKEEQVRSLKTRLEEAVHQNNKMTNAAELKDDKIKTLQERLEASSKEQQKLTEMLESQDKRAEKEKAQKQKGNSSQTIIFKPANNTRSEQNTLEMLSIADRRVAELTEEIMMLAKQNGTVTVQNEAMSARNAQLQIENESMKNELENAKADYAELQSDMNDVRDYYHQVDVAASNMEHRCEMLSQLNATLEEENKALVEQVNRLVEQNQGLLVKSLEDKDQFIDDERAFSGRIYALQRQKENLEKQVDLANKALAESVAKPKKKPNFLARVMRKAGLKKKKDESPKGKANNVQLVKIDQSPYFEEFETSNSVVSQEGGLLVATPLNRRDETGSEGSRESSTSGDSRAAAKSLLNASAQSDVVLRRHREGGTLSPYVSTPVLLRHEEGDFRHDCLGAQDVSAFRARQVRSAIFTETDWSPSRLPRPRSMDSLDKVGVTSSSLASADVGSSDARHGNDEVTGTLPRSKKQGMMKHLSPSASPRGLRKARWAQSSPNISPVVARKDFVNSLEPPPPSPPSPTSSKKSESPRESPVVARRVEDRPLVWSPTHSPLLTKREKKKTTISGLGLSSTRRASMPINYRQNLDTVPVRDRPLDVSKPKVSVQVVAVANASDASVSQKSSLSNHEDQWDIIPLERLNGDVSGAIAPDHERQHSGTSERSDEPMTSTPREGSFSKESITESSRSNAQHVRERSSSGNRNDGLRAKDPPNRDIGQKGPVHLRERSLSGDKNSGLRVIHAKDTPNQDTAQSGPVYPPNCDAGQRGPDHLRERSFSGDKNSGLRVIHAKDTPNQDTVQSGPSHSRSLSADRSDVRRASQRQGTLFVASSIPRQSVPVTAHYVTTGTVAKSEAIPPATSGEGETVYIDATGSNVSSTSAVSLGSRAEVSSSSVYAVVRDKQGDERVIAAPPSRDLPTPSRDQLQFRSSLPNSGAPSSQGSLPLGNSSSLRYTTSSTSRDAVVAASVDVKQSFYEHKDENRNDTKLHVTAATTQEASKQNVTSVRARIRDIESQSPPKVLQAREGANDNDDDDALSVSSQPSRDCSPALRKVRNKGKKPSKEKEIFIDSPPSSDAVSSASSRRSSEEKSRPRPGGANQEDKKSSLWYEYGCV
ncbi:girdin-like isoform X2 [Montipora foliosa]|uniref:girdin-like isoform X2 n=1 Tax=Montipora foliosa TaxID=591990 RepID=UPI0035F15595